MPFWHFWLNQAVNNWSRRFVWIVLHFWSRYLEALFKNTEKKPVVIQSIHNTFLLESNLQGKKNIDVNGLNMILDHFWPCFLGVHPTSTKGSLGGHHGIPIFSVFSQAAFIAQCSHFFKVGGLEGQDDYRSVKNVPWFVVFHGCPRCPPHVFFYCTILDSNM